MKLSLILLFEFLFFLVSGQEALFFRRIKLYTDDNKILVQDKYNTDCAFYLSDSFIIKPQTHIDIITNYGKDTVEKVRYSIMYYNLINLRTKTVYQFDSFSTKSKIKNVIYPQDTVNWESMYFYNSNNSQIPKFQKKNWFSDTTINNILYKRFGIENSIQNNGTNSTFQQIFYIRCDVKNTFYHIDGVYDKENECSIARRDFKSTETPFWVAHFIEYERFYLTKQEKAIFRKWKRRAKKYKSK